MNLTERERAILQLAKQGLSDYKIARRISMDPPNVTRSHKNAQKKLNEALTDLVWAYKLDLRISNPFHYSAVAKYSYFL